MSALDLQTIERYIKNSNQIDADKIEISWLPQSKLYLKIISLPYLIENTNILVTLEVVEKIFKSNHIFKNILIASHLRIIKVLSKSDIAIIWLDIWNSQNGTNAKGLTNRYFNVESFILTIYRVNMNPGISQYKKC